MTSSGGRAVASQDGEPAPPRGHDVLPFAPEQLEGKPGERVEVVVIPPPAGNCVYLVQLEDAQGGTSNVAEACLIRVYRLKKGPMSCARPPELSQAMAADPKAAQGHR